MSVYAIVKETVRLSDTTKKLSLREPLIYNNKRATAFRVEVLSENSDSPADLTGVGVTGKFLRKKDDTTVLPILGTVSGNVAEVILPGACYSVSGRFTFTMDLTQSSPTTGVAAFSTSVSYVIGDRVVYNSAVYVFVKNHSAGAWDADDVAADIETRSILIVEGAVEKASSDSAIDPGSPITSVDQAIANANSAASSANSAATAANNAADVAETAATEAQDLVLVQESQPSESLNKLWIKASADTEVQVPTYEEFSDLQNHFAHEWTESENIFNPDEFQQNKVIDNSGNVNDSSNFGITTNYYELPFTGDNYFYINSSNVGTAFDDYKGVAYIVTYDSSKTFISRIAMSAQNYGGVTTTNGAKYVRFVIGKNTSDLMLIVRQTYDSTIDPVFIPYHGKFTTNAEERIGEVVEDISDNDFDVPLKHIIKTGGLTGIFRTAGVVGDSLSSGCMEYKDENNQSQGLDRYEFSWLQQMKHICGFDTAYNFSAGGLTSKKFWTSTNTHITDLREDGENHKCQLYFIALGVNDIADTTLDVGTSEDISDDESTTFYGYYSRIIKLIQTIQPKARIFLVGLPNHSEMTVWGDRFKAFKNAIADMATHFDYCYYLDLYTYDVSYNGEFNQMYFNGFHENALGYLRTAWMISSYVDWYIRHNYEEFREVGFIGTNYHYYSE